MLFSRRLFVNAISPPLHTGLSLNVHLSLLPPDACMFFKTWIAYQRRLFTICNNPYFLCFATDNLDLCMAVQVNIGTEARTLLAKRPQSGWAVPWLTSCVRPNGRRHFCLISVHWQGTLTVCFVLLSLLSAIYNQWREVHLIIYDPDNGKHLLRTTGKCDAVSLWPAGGRLRN